jgi:hypothetical protein
MLVADPDLDNAVALAVLAGSDLSTYSPVDLLRVENELNQRPRAILGHQAPATLFTQLLASNPRQRCEDRWEPPRR